MKKVLFALLTLIFLFTEISALCENGQVDINNANLTELDKLSGIGPVKAQAIIDTRPFNSVDNLIDVNGIGEAILDKIKTQNLACVNGENEEKEQEENVQDEEEVNHEEPQENSEETNESEIIEPLQKETIITGEGVETIVLNPKDIKSETDKEQLNKNKLAIYGLIVFCILLAFLFIFKRKNNKNEFR